MARPAQRPEIVAIYCPLWHNYDHMSAWKGEGWCEWELVKSAIPRFPGHYQPLQPSWGFFDESDPKWSAREIALAADHGIDVFLFDWYWYSGVRIMEEALERGFLKSPNRRRIKFALMWANHDWSDYFPPPFGKTSDQWNMWLPSRHSSRDLSRVIDYCIRHYFRQSNYWTVHGRLFFSIFQPVKFVQELGGPESTRKLLGSIDRRLRSEDLPPIHWNAMLWNAEPVPALKQAGFHSTTTYAVNNPTKVSTNLTGQYEDLMEAHRNTWHTLTAAPLPYCPVVSMGWDVTPRCVKDIPWPFPPSPATGRHDYPYMSVTVGNTPELYEQLCRDALEHVRTTRPRPNAIFLNAWNEWTEGSYLLPERRYGTAFLEALQRAFA